MSATTIPFAEDLDLPLEIVTQPCGILARRGWGKTYTAKLLAEGMIRAGAQVVIVDPVGVWYGLTMSADGTGPGLEIPVLGGLHGDVELREGDAAAVARLVAEEGLTAVLDVSLMSKAARQRFVARLAEGIFQGKKTHRSALHIILEEAQLFAPQRSARGDTAVMLGAVEDLCRLGRNVGIGYTLVSQRPQSVNKEVLNQVEVLIVGQISGPHERAAINDWVVHQDFDVAAMVQELPSLQQGEAFFWSPSWLREARRIRVGQITTFDSSSTPVVGARDVKPVARPSVDPEALREALEAAGAAEREEDPRDLRRRIAELERELVEPAEPQVEFIEVPILSDEDRELLQELRDTLDTILDATAPDATARAPQAPRPPSATQAKATPQPARPPATERKPVPTALATDAAQVDGLPKGEGRVLAAVVQLGGRVSGRRAVLMAGYSPRSSTARNILSGLRTRGLIEGSLTGELEATQEARIITSRVPSLPRGEELRRFWLEKVPGGAPRAVLEALIRVYPRELSPEEIEEATGYSATSSTLRNAASRLRGFELVEGRGSIRASDDLFI